MRQVLNLDDAGKPPKWVYSVAGKKDGVLKNTTSNVRALTRSMYDDTHAKFQNRKDHHYYALEFNVPAGWEPCLDVGNGPTIYPQIYAPSTPQDVTEESVLRYQGTPYALSALNAKWGGAAHENKTCKRQNVLEGPLTPSFIINDGRKTLNDDLNYNMNPFRAQNDKASFMHSHLYRQSVDEIIGEPNRNQIITQLATRDLYHVPKRERHAKYYDSAY